ncbi:MAG: hypothetical protein R3E40_04095 [Rhodocyclaceae bacterium]
MSRCAGLPSSPRPPLVAEIGAIEAARPRCLMAYLGLVPGVELWEAAGRDHQGRNSHAGD